MKKIPMTFKLDQKVVSKLRAAQRRSQPATTMTAIVQSGIVLVAEQMKRRETAQR